MLEISVRKVAQVALMARELGRAEGELRGFIDTLTEEEATSLVAVMWIGRDSFSADELEAAIATAANEATTPASEYLIGTPLLADHLEAGLEALGLSASEEEDDLMRP
ncbi:DUF3775 domain-containing protein [Litorivita sp. NS0012-18]|uniref:DUF3775 domain-containing protein n=1 Tax=Litorivita sp. NS0012-18 TaxID=3127655 RepID=UPI0031062DB9